MKLRNMWQKIAVNQCEYANSNEKTHSDSEVCDEQKQNCWYRIFCDLFVSPCAFLFFFFFLLERITSFFFSLSYWMEKNAFTIKQLMMNPHQFNFYKFFFVVVVAVTLLWHFQQKGCADLVLVKRMQMIIKCLWDLYTCKPDFGSGILKFT